MPWRERLARKVTTAEEAVRLIRPGRRILIGSGAAEPVTLVRALVSGGEHLADNEVVHLMTLGPAPYVRPGLEHRFRHTAFFIGANTRAAVHEGRADFMPVFLSEIPELLRSRRMRIDVALISVSPPDRHGYASLGVSVDIVRAAVESAELVVAEVNERMPRSLGDSFVHVDRIDALVPADYPPLELPKEPLDDVARAIGEHVATLVPDGATLQVGIGRIPDALLAALGGRRDLGIHTEMLSDGIMRLAEAGVVTGRRKTLLPGKIVTSFVMGSSDLYAWLHDNPAVEMRPSDFTNDPFVIARNERMVAVNAALAVDLTGQVAADTLMGKFFSGIGGQVDFIRGASRSRAGRAIIALRATARNGAVSRIVPALEEGAGVVTSRGDVRYVVTEFGVADLWGRNVRERAMALIAVAHPDFRADLLAAAKARRYVFLDQVVPRANYPFAETRLVKLPKAGVEVEIRPARVTDEEPIQDFFYRLSDETVYRRFLAHRRTHPHEEIQDLVDLDYDQNMALVAVLPTSQEIVAVARYDVDPATRFADVAFVVRDDWQGKGLGTILLRRLSAIARARGISGFEADALASNKPMLMVFHRSGLAIEATLEGNVYHIRARFESRDRGERDDEPGGSAARPAGVER